MGLTELPEEKKLIEIAERLGQEREHKNQVFTAINKDLKSYWIDYASDTDSELEEYCYQTPAQLKERFRRQWLRQLEDRTQAADWEKMLSVITVWAFKRRPVFTCRTAKQADITGETDTREDFHLPDFVYRF